MQAPIHYPYGFVLVIAEGGCLLGRLRASALAESDPGSMAEAEAFLSSRG